jgi:RNA-directed DNA polymerase
MLEYWVWSNPQGGVLLPLLSNILLHEPDRELERLSREFCRYAEHCNIFVRSDHTGKRVIDSIERFLSEKLKLMVNHKKSAVAKPHQRRFLGFSFTSGRQLKIKLSVKALKRVKHRINLITPRSWSVWQLQVIKELSTFLRGWFAYCRLIEMPTVLRDLLSWIRRRQRCFVMKQRIKN